MKTVAVFPCLRNRAPRKAVSGFPFRGAPCPTSTVARELRLTGRQDPLQRFWAVTGV
jgi:hypothetical protein